MTNRRISILQSSHKTGCNQSQYTGSLPHLLRRILRFGGLFEILNRGKLVLGEYAMTVVHILIGESVIGSLDMTTVYTHTREKSSQSVFPLTCVIGDQ